MSWWCSRRAAAPAARPLPRYSGLSAKRSTAPKIPARQITADSPRKARARGAAQTALRAVSADFVRSGGFAAGGCAPPFPPVLLHPQALSRRKSVKIALCHPLQGAKRPPRCPVLSAPGSRPSGRGAAPPSGAPPAGRPCISRRVISWRGRLCSATAPECRPVSR